MKIKVAWKKVACVNGKSCKWDFHLPFAVREEKQQVLYRCRKCGKKMWRQLSPAGFGFAMYLHAEGRIR